MSDTETRDIPIRDDDDDATRRAETTAEVDPAEAVRADGVEPEVQPPLSDDAEAAVQTEVEILRGELAKAEAARQAAENELDELKQRWLRARADLENLRRRTTGELERARAAGLDSAVLSVLNVYDDLSRALDMADENDPAKILPGIRAVRDGLERNLQTLGIVRVGEVGDRFDPDLHEALTAVPAQGGQEPGTIAQVFEAGFQSGDRLVRPARVVVVQEE